MQMKICDRLFKIEKYQHATVTMKHEPDVQRCFKTPWVLFRRGQTTYTQRTQSYVFCVFLHIIVFIAWWSDAVCFLDSFALSVMTAQSCRSSSHCDDEHRQVRTEPRLDTDFSSTHFLLSFFFTLRLQLVIKLIPQRREFGETAEFWRTEQV